MNANHKSSYSLGSYVLGFALSIILTLIPYTLVVKHALSRGNLFVIIVLSALAQLVVQLKFFLHLNFSPRQRENLLSFVFTAIIVIVIVFGSIWIIHDLNYYMMDPIMDQHQMQMK